MSRRLCRALLTGALALVIVAPSRLDAVPAPLPIGVWIPFLWFEAGPIVFPADGFFLEALGTTQLRVVDLFAAGDAFDVYVNGALAFATPNVPTGSLADFVGNPDAAWADDRFSRGSVTLGPGSYNIWIDVRAAPLGAGAAAIRADAVQHGVVPEPISLVLLGTGLAGVAGARRRRRQALLN